MSISIRGGGEIVAAVPYLFGFEVERSLVVLDVNGGFCGRCDFDPAGLEQWAHVCAQNAPAVIVLGYETVTGECQPWLDQLVGTLAASGVEIVDQW